MHTATLFVWATLVIFFSLSAVDGFVVSTISSGKQFHRYKGVISKLHMSTDSDIKVNRDILYQASLTKSEKPETIVEALLSLEKLMRVKNKEDKGVTAKTTIKALNGAWRLVFTTGTVDTQKKIGRINYFPLKAVQTFDTTSGRISNSIMVGDFALLKFFGEFEFLEAPRKLVFDFDQIAVLGLKFNLPKGGAAKIGSSTGLGSENNVELVNRGKTPFFNWISADADIATARGGGGGLALWRRDTETPL